MTDAEFRELHALTLRIELADKTQAKGMREIRKALKVTSNPLQYANIPQMVTDRQFQEQERNRWFARQLANVAGIQ